MADTIAGYKFILSLDIGGGVMAPIGCATDCAINETYDTREISGPQGKWRDYIPDYAGYTLSAPGLQVYTAPAGILLLQNYGRSGTRFNWSASAFDNGGIIEKGTILITQLNKTAQFRDAMRFDMTAIGCGAPQTVFAPIQTIVYLSDFEKVQLAGCPNPYPITLFWYDLTMIGPADNADDVIAIFNAYSALNGSFYTLTSSVDGGCRFNMSISYLAPKPYPTTIFAQPGAAFALSDNQLINNMLSPDQISDQGLTPIG